MRTNLLKYVKAATAALFIALFALPATAQEKEAYAVMSLADKTFSFYYDSNKAAHTDGTVYGLAVSYRPEWFINEEKAQITILKFDKSMKDYQPVSTAFWFYDFNNLTTVEGIEHLNTGKVKSMESMFSGCRALTSLDVSNFNTENVEDMSFMFSDCHALTSLDASNFNTEKVTVMARMFYRCRALTSLDASNFNSKKVNYMDRMFSYCAELTTIYCNADWNRKGLDSYEMFINCAKLKGAVAYDESRTDATMANPTTGYFTKKGATAIQQPVAGDVAARKQDIYNLNGVRMGNDLDRLPKGVYIVNGKKVVKR